MENWLICWEGIASTKLFMVATLVSKLPFMYQKGNFLYYFAHDCTTYYTPKFRLILIICGLKQLKLRILSVLNFKSTLGFLCNSTKLNWPYSHSKIIKIMKIKYLINFDWIIKLYAQYLLIRKGYTRIEFIFHKKRQKKFQKVPS